jgi:hypothetical protein
MAFPMPTTVRGRRSRVYAHGPAACLATPRVAAAPGLHSGWPP